MAACLLGKQMLTLAARVPGAPAPLHNRRCFRGLTFQEPLDDAVYVELVNIRHRDVSFNHK